MDDLTFISSLVHDLAWPIVVVAGLLIFRAPLVELITQLKHFSGFGVKTDFQRELNSISETVKENANEATLPVDLTAALQRSANKQYLAFSVKQIADTDGKIIDRAAALANESPSGAVLLAFEAVDRAVSQLATESDGAMLRGMQVVEAQDDWLAGAVIRLRALRNKVAHNPRTIDELAKEYVDLCRPVVAELQLLFSQLLAKSNQS